MPGEHVDRAALAIDREADLRDGLPAVVAKDLDNRLDQGRMFRIEQAVGSFATPADLWVKASPQGCEDPLERPKGYPVCATALDPGDQRLGHPGAAGEINLPPPPSDPQRPEHASDPNEVHGAAA